MRRWPLLLAAACQGAPPIQPDAVTPADGVEPSPTVRALSSRELRFALEDLVGADLASLSFPEDPRAGGFDNQDAATPVSDALVDALDRAAQTAASAWTDRLLGPAQVVQLDERVASHGCALEDIAHPDDAKWLLWLRRGVTLTVHAPADGRYVLEVPLAARISQQQRGFLTAEVAVDAGPAWRIGLDDDGETVSLILTLTLTAGDHAVTVNHASGLSPDADMEEFLRGPCQEAAALVADAVTLYGPVAPDWTCGEHARSDDPCVAAPAVALTRRAWRHGPDAQALDRLTSLLHTGWLADRSMASGLGIAVQASLLSPHLLLVPPARGLTAPDDGAIATRLALAVWSSLPDDALLDCVDEGTLLTDDPTCSLDAQLTRLLDDPRATRLALGLSRQWLGLERLDATAGAGEAPWEAMVEETASAVQRALDAPERSLDALVRDTVTTLRPELAAWYGVRATPTGVVDLEGTGRAGLLTHASVLALTSSGDRASAVRRGAWVREALLCDPPQPPPPGIPLLDEDADPRDALAAHTANPACSGCHATLDPLGLALDGFDATGRAAQREPSPAALPDGTALPDAPALWAWVLDQDRLERCLTSRIAAWTLGTPVDPDAPAVARWLAQADDKGWRALLRAITHDPMFRGVAR